MLLLKLPKIRERSFITVMVGWEIAVGVVIFSHVV